MPVDTTLKALDDPIRRRILHLLKDHAMTVSELVSHFDISQPAISRHLSILKKPVSSGTAARENMCCIP